MHAVGSRVCTDLRARHEFRGSCSRAPCSYVFYWSGTASHVMRIKWVLQLEVFCKLYSFHSIILFQATRPIQTIQTLDKLDNKTENQYRENDKNTENIKHTVKQPRQKMNVGLHAHLHNLKRLYQYKALLLALQRATSDFSALFIRVSKLSKPVKSSIFVTL